MNIIFSGGGTLGPVTPLLAIHETIKKSYPHSKFLWVGTARGPERTLVEKEGVRFVSLSAGKFRRYVSLWNITDLLRIIVGFFQSLRLLIKESPDLCISAGGFVSVPVHWAAWLLGIPTWIHQQDVRPGLANKLMAPMATVITTTLEESVSLFSANKTLWLGNPVRKELCMGDIRRAKKLFNVSGDLPIVFATGGGTGSMRVNQLVVQAVQHLSGTCEVIHLSGKERPQELVERAVQHFDYYQVHQFFTHEMKDAYAIASLVISRGGFGTLSEIAALGKPAILIPKPGHQEDNVRFLAEAGAVILVDETLSDGNRLAKIIKDVLADSERMIQMGRRLQEKLPIADEEQIQTIVDRLLTHKK